MSKFRIEGDYYLVIDQYSYNLQRYKGNRTRDGKEEDNWEVIGYYRTIEQVLNAYLDVSVRKALQSGGEGELKDAMRIISSEIKRLRETLKNAFSEVVKWNEDI